MADLANKRRFRATVEYDGTDYHGFQIQPGVPTVQRELEAALERVTQGCDEGSPARIVGAGRTDAGVHSVGQVIHFDSLWSRSVAGLQRALNALLPPDIALRDLAMAPAGFHARYSASSRQYVYSVLNQETRSPLRERFACRVPGAVDVAAMNEAASHMVGTHDCAAFGQPPSGSTTVRTVFRAVWTQRGSELRFDVLGNAYLRKMVRRLVGTLLWVGQGKLSSAEFEGILRAGVIGRSAPPAPPCGLCLVRVNY